jgi:hypothetical protein
VGDPIALVYFDADDATDREAWCARCADEVRQRLRDTVAAKRTDANPARLFFESLPPRFREPAYKALAKVIHPDVGGDGPTMQALNAAWQAIAAQSRREAG